MGHRVGHRVGHSPGHGLAQVLYTPDQKQPFFGCPQLGHTFSMDIKLRHYYILAALPFCNTVGSNHVSATEQPTSKVL